MGAVSRSVSRRVESMMAIIGHSSHCGVLPATRSAALCACRRAVTGAPARGARSAGRRSDLDCPAAGAIIQSTSWQGEQGATWKPNDPTSLHTTGSGSGAYRIRSAAGADIRAETRASLLLVDSRERDHSPRRTRSTYGTKPGQEFGLPASVSQGKRSSP